MKQTHFNTTPVLLFKNREESSPEKMKGLYFVGKRQEPNRKGA